VTVTVFENRDWCKSRFSETVTGASSSTLNRSWCQSRFSETVTGHSHGFGKP
jgi:hypothetical protein